MEFRWGDALLIAIFIMLAVLSFLAMRQSPGDVAASVSQNSKELYNINLSQVENEFTITIASDFTNVITVREGAIGFTTADCPDKVCVHTGFNPNRGRPPYAFPTALKSI